MPVFGRDAPSIHLRSGLRASEQRPSLLANIQLR